MKHFSRLILAISTSIFIFLLMIIAFFAFTQKTVETTNILDYGLFRNYTGNTSLTYEIFPNEIPSDSVASDYYFLWHPVFWVNPDIQVYLKLTYSASGFLEEIERLNGLLYSIEDNSEQGLMFSEDLFQYSSYIGIFAYYYAFEYALVDYDSFSIVYVSMQYQDRNDVYFDVNYLPDGYEQVARIGFEPGISYYLHHPLQGDDTVLD